MLQGSYMDLGCHGDIVICRLKSEHELENKNSPVVMGLAALLSQPLVLTANRVPVTSQVQDAALAVRV